MTEALQAQALSPLLLAGREAGLPTIQKMHALQWPWSGGASGTKDHINHVKAWVMVRLSKNA